MQGRLNDPLGWTFFNDAAGIHDQDATDDLLKLIRIVAYQ
jgi:hypothetical protein